VHILKESETDVLNFSRFWLRPNIPAAKYDKKDFIDGSESKWRSKRIRDEFEVMAIEQNQKWLNWEGEAIVIEEGKEGTHTFVARNYNYKPIILPKQKGLKLGDKVKVKINDITWYDFRGVVIE
jgi:tRNA A37 methylthiotransferase MiaB